MNTIRAELDTEFSNALGENDPASAPMNGGYVAQTIISSLRQVEEQRHPRSASFRFLAPSRIGALDIEFSALRSSSSSAVYLMNASQNCTATVVGHVDVANSEQAMPSATMPRVGSPEDYEDVPLSAALRPRFARNVDYRLISDAAIFSGAAKAEHLVWLRPRHTLIDAAALAFISDAMHPTPLIATTRPTNLATADLQMHWCGDLAPLPENSWVLGYFVMRSWEERWAVEDGTIWSADGRQLMLCRQSYRMSGTRQTG